MNFAKSAKRIADLANSLYYDRMTEATIQLSSGHVAHVVYTITFGEMIIALLLICILFVQVFSLWKGPWYRSS